MGRSARDWRLRNRGIAGADAKADRRKASARYYLARLLTHAVINYTVGAGRSGDNPVICEITGGLGT